MVSKRNLQLIERYEMLGETRYRLRVKETNIVLNVKALSEEEAYEKALRMLRDLGLSDEVIKKLQELGRSRHSGQ